MRIKFIIKYNLKDLKTSLLKQLEMYWQSCGKNKPTFTYSENTYWFSLYENSMDKSEQRFNKD